MKLLPGVIAHRFVHSRLQTLATLQDFIQLSLSMDRVFIFINADHLSVSTAKLASLAATNSSGVLFAHWLVMELHLKAAVVHTREQS